MRFAPSVPANSAPFFLTERFSPLLDSGENTLKGILNKLRRDLSSVPKHVRATPAFKRVKKMLHELGSTVPERSSQKPGAIGSLIQSIQNLGNGSSA